MNRVAFIYWRDRGIHNEELTGNLLSRLGWPVVFDELVGRYDVVFYTARNEFPSPQLIEDAESLADRGEVYARLVDVVLNVDGDRVRRYISGTSVIDGGDVERIYSTIVEWVDNSDRSVPIAGYLFRQLGEYNVLRVAVPPEFRKALVNRRAHGIRFAGFPYYYVRVRTLLDIWEWSARTLFGTEVGREVFSSLRARTWDEAREKMLGMAREGLVPKDVENALRRYSQWCGLFGITKYVQDTIRWFNTVFGTDIYTCSSGEIPDMARRIVPNQSLARWGVYYSDFFMIDTEHYYTTWYFDPDPMGATAKIARAYDAVLMRPPDTPGLLHYTMSGMPIGDVAKALINSEEYARIPRTNHRKPRRSPAAPRLPVSIMQFLARVGDARVKPRLLIIGCLDEEQRMALEGLFEVRVLNFGCGGCEVNTDVWFTDVGYTPFSVVVITECAWRSHPFRQYLLTTAHALLTDYGYLIAPAKVSIEGKRVLTGKYSVFEKLIIL